MKITVTIIKSLQPGYSGRTWGYWWRYNRFTTVVDDNGSKHYFVEHEPTTKEEAENAYREIKRMNDAFKSTKEYAKYKRDNEPIISKQVTEYEVTPEECITYLEKQIDPYTNYIDDYECEKRADRANASIRKRINIVKEWHK